jgi:hypothetical protein
MSFHLPGSSPSGMFGLAPPPDDAYVNLMIMEKNNGPRENKHRSATFEEVYTNQKNCVTLSLCVIRFLESFSLLSIDYLLYGIAKVLYL